MTSAEIKRVLKIGGSLVIVLPRYWTKGRIKAGEEMVVVGNGELRIFPSPFEEKWRKRTDVSIKVGHPVSLTRPKF